MKRWLKSSLAFLFLSLLLLGGVTVHAITQAQDDGRLINYVGIVRGATQRLVKLELAGQPSDELIIYLDSILDELNGTAGEFGLPCPNDAHYQEDLHDLTQMWDNLKGHIAAYRENTEDSAPLVMLSEAYFMQANNTVFCAEAYTVHQNHMLLLFCLVMLAVMLLTWAFIFWAASRKILRLEDTNQKLNDLTQRDPLTGVYQIKAFKEQAQRLINSHPEYKFAVLHTDFSDFKYINDVFGYDYGDSILSHYGALLRDGLSKHELAGRVSADNFVLLLRCEDRKELVLRQRSTDEKITEFMSRSHDRQSLTTCCGICCIEDVIESLEIGGYLDRANFARKTVKTGSRQNYVFYDDSIRHRLWEQKSIERRMYDALDRREFTVYYQPKVKLETGRAASAEALVRWRSDDGAIIPPDRFIPVFEQKLMIDRLDRYVMDDVCRWLRSRLDAKLPVLPVSVNVSRLQFYDVGFVDRYVEIRDKYHIPPELLELEFTESIAFENTEVLLSTIQALKAAGFACAIDDFGKGYSSLSLLKQLPVDVLKIDSLFFTDSGDCKRDNVIVAGIIDMVHKFGIRTVAEGIEHPDQVSYLKQIGCDYVQGYVFYRPLPQADFEKLLDSGN